MSQKHSLGLGNVSVCSGVLVSLATFPLNGSTRLSLLTEGVLDTVKLLDCVDQPQSKHSLQRNFTKV